ncbi:MAG: helix-turn-helix domain-containing protein [Chlorobi bacterium]|nr:helix-turn-helix domain-containing protein [Chlorobiota bacterium]MCI0717162.1 helix-turn-helix domain-containing protein [Chlorobiota bacterium]
MKDKDKNLVESIGGKIKKLRLKCNLTQEQLAESLRVHSNYIYLIEKGKRNITLIKFIKLLKILNVKPNIFLEEFFL